MITNDLDLMDEVDEVTQAVATGFEVRDLESADWCLRKVSSAERRMQLRHELVLKRKAQLDEWEAQANRTDLSTTERMAELLKPWAEHEVALNSAKKSISLPTGTVGFRQSPDSIEVVNLADAVLHLKELGAADCIRVREEVDKRALMTRVKAGEALPEGCELHEGHRNFYVKISSDGATGD